MEAELREALGLNPNAADAEVTAAVKARLASERALRAALVRIAEAVGLANNASEGAILAELHTRLSGSTASLTVDERRLVEKMGVDPVEYAKTKSKLSLDGR